MQRVSFAFTTVLGLALMFVSNAAVAQYQLTNLDSNQVRAARHTDPLLVNGWGLVHAPGSPWWVSDNSSGWSTLYDNKGVQVQTLKVLIPTAGENGPGLPTGIVWNASTSSEFQVQGWASISCCHPGWNNQRVGSAVEFQRSYRGSKTTPPQAPCTPAWRSPINRPELPVRCRSGKQQGGYI